jgi:7-cyano-7-deazaguanine synthase
LDRDVGGIEATAMSMVTLVSGGLDSTVMATLAAREGIAQYPLFINYGQINADREWLTCQTALRRLSLPVPKAMEIPGFGRTVRSGLTDRSLHIVDEAFLPCRNLLFLTIGAAYACQQGASVVAIGLLSQDSSLFPDQTDDFIYYAGETIARALPKRIRIHAPLMRMTKQDSVTAAKRLGVGATYSCHAGLESPCGECIACREFHGLEV